MWDFILKLGKSVISPVTNRVVPFVLGLKWIHRVLILVLLLIVYGFYKYPKEALSYASELGNYLEVIRPKNLPASSATKGAIKEYSEELTPYLQNALEKRGTPDDYLAWATAQHVLALQGKMNLPEADLGRFFHEQELKGQCGCWSEYGGTPPHIAASGWILTAMASINQPATDDELHFLVDTQNKREGWWSIYPAKDDRRNASTYATAWAVLGLAAQLEKKLVQSRYESQVIAAIQNGRYWLEHAHIEGKARWSDYPFSDEKIESVSISGLVLHVLHKAGMASDQNLDRLWLQELPPTFPLPSSRQVSTQAISLPNGKYFRDSLLLIDFPWLVMATVDAYPAGSWTERAFALSAIKHSITEISTVKQTLLTFPFVAAEVEISLRYLNKEKVNGSDVI